MSVEDGISQGVSVGVSAPAVSGGGFSPSSSFASEGFSQGPSFSSFESFSNISPSISSPDISGGALFGGTSFEGLMSESKIFSPSIGSVPEMAVPKTTDIFSQEFKTVAQNQFPTEAKTVDLNIPGFREFIPSISQTPEMPISKAVDIFSGEFKTIAKVSAEQSTPKILEVDIAQKVEKLDIAGFKDFTLLTQAVPELSPHKEFTPSEGGVEILVSSADKIAEQQTQRELIYIRGILDELTYKKQDQKTSLEVEAETKPQTKLVLKAQELIKEEEKVKEEEEKDEKKRKKKNGKDTLIKLLKLVVDENAQASRKKTFRQKISNAFEAARRKKTESVKSGDFTKDLVEEKSHKSNVLYQLKHPSIPDGSFHEAADDISNIGVFEDTTQKSEDAAYVEAERILNKKVPVELSYESKNHATDEDLRRVVKLAKVVSPLA